MKNISDGFYNIFEKCELLLDDKPFSQELIMQAYKNFVCQTIDKKEHNVGVVFHTGSECFDALMITFSAIANLVLNQTSSIDVIDSLEDGDLVIFGEKKKERYVFKGIVEGVTLDKKLAGKKYVKLSQGDKNINYIIENQWRLIEPYNGNSKSLDGRGIKKKKTLRDDFFIEVLGKIESEIPSVIDSSTVLVISREKVDRIIKHINISFGKKVIGLLDIVTASYYTEEESYSYGGNVGKSEPILKFCSKISIARRLLIKKNGTNNIGLVIFGQDIINRSETEIPSLLDRKKIKYIYLCTRIDVENNLKYLEDREDLEVFICSKEFVENNTTEEPLNNNSYTKLLNAQINNIIYKENNIMVIDGGVTVEDYRIFRKEILNLKRDNYKSDEKDSFIITAFSLMNFFLSSVFSIRKYNKAIRNNLIEVKKIDEKLKDLEKWINYIPDSLCKSAFIIYGLLRRLNEKMWERNKKENWIRSYLLQNKKKQICIVVPKAYYGTIIKECGLVIPVMIDKVFVCTPERFDNTKNFDAIIVVGNINRNKFNMFNCISSREIITVLYRSELGLYEYSKRLNCAKKYLYNKKSTLKIQSIIPENTDMDKMADDEIMDDKEIEEYVFSVENTINTFQINNMLQSVKANIYTEVVAVAVFTDESKAFFSKNYKAYIIDSDDGNVNEIAAKEIKVGDSIIFTKNNNETKDIVDSILRQMIKEGRVKDEIVLDYKKSKEWHDSLIDYMNQNEYSSRMVAEEMMKLKVSVQESTIVGWLDEDSHTIGPRNIDSFQVIGKLTGNNNLANNPESYDISCKNIRSIRRRIKNEIGKAIICKLSGKRIIYNSEFGEVLEKIDSLAEVKQVDNVILINEKIPINLSNHPINV